MTLFAECDCPTGLRPLGSCKHIGALSYAMADFCKVRSLPEYKTCTEKLQKWNKPRGKRVEPIPVEKLDTRHRQLLPERLWATESRMVYDPHPVKFQTTNPQALEELCCNLLKLENAPAFLNIVMPSLSKISHDHCYCKVTRETSDDDSIEPSVETNEPVPSSCANFNDI